MTTLADRVLTAERTAFEALAQHVELIDDSGLAAPSAAREWSVAQVLSHLGSGAEIHLATLQQARKGKARGADANSAVWAHWDNLQPALQAKGFVEAGLAVLEEYDDLGAEERAELRVPLAYLPQPAPLELFAGLRLNEVALHAWDVRVAADPAAELDTTVADVLIELLRGPIGFMPSFTGKADQLDQHRLLAVQAGGERFGLDIGERVQIVPEPDQADGELRLAAPVFPRLLSGRLRDSDEIDITGPVSRADLLRVFPGY
jgi:uncharacterized protein (TIGR03083 family)